MSCNLFFNSERHSSLEEIKDPFLVEFGVSIYIKRDDLIHPLVSGNKWRKLKYNFEEAIRLNKTAILSFGGAYSNHLHALAAAGQLAGIRTIGIVRGEEAIPHNPTIKFAISKGMKIVFESRTNYRLKAEPAYLENLLKIYGNIYIIPEGGTNAFAIKGCMEIVNEIDIDYDYICAPCGSAGTVTGIIAAKDNNKRVIAFSALKGDGMHEKKILELLEDKTVYLNWEVNYNYHFGGYAKVKIELVNFIDYFKITTGISLEPIYTGKMMFGIYDLIKKGYFKKGERIIALHTGGMQGMEGLQPHISKLVNTN